jgi:hypothetical protein
MDIQLNRLILIFAIFLSQNVWSECQNQQILSFSSLEDLNQLAFQDCTSTRNDNRKKCECQKQNSKIIPDVSPQLLLETKKINTDEVKKQVRDNIDEMIQYFLALETNVELTAKASETCSLARINQINCPKSKKPIINQIYPNGANELLKQSQCQLKQKYNMACDGEVKPSSSCLDEGTRLALIFKERENPDYLKNFQARLRENTEESAKDEVHPALKIIMSDVQLKTQFLALAPQKLSTFIKSPAVSEKISQNIAQSCEQKLQNMQTLLCSDISDLQQIPLKQIVKSEKTLIKQKPKDLNDLVNYQQQLNLFCQNLEKPSLEKSIVQLNQASMPAKFDGILAANDKEHAPLCAMINPPLNLASLNLAAKECKVKNLTECASLNILLQIFQARESTTPSIANSSNEAIDETPEFFSKQLKTFFGENTKPALIEQQPEGSKVSVANYHEEMLERDQARANNQKQNSFEQPIIEISKTSQSVIPVSAQSVIPTYKQSMNDDFEFQNHAQNNLEISKRQAQFIEHERKNNSQIMKHFQNINQKQIDMIEKMANKIIQDNEVVESDDTKHAIHTNSSLNKGNIVVAPHSIKQPTIKVGGSSVGSEGQNQIVYIDNSNIGNGEKSSKTSGNSFVEPNNLSPSHATTYARTPASTDESSQLQHVEVIHKDQTQHKKYDEIIVSLNLSEGDKLADLKPHELEKISKYLEEKRPFILKKVFKDQKSGKNIDATILVGENSYITIIPNKKVTPTEQKEYLMIKKELENLMKLKLSQILSNSPKASRL